MDSNSLIERLQAKRGYYQDFGFKSDESDAKSSGIDVLIKDFSFLLSFFYFTFFYPREKKMVIFKASVQVGPPSQTEV